MRPLPSHLCYRLTLPRVFWKGYTPPVAEHGTGTRGPLGMPFIKPTDTHARGCGKNNGVFSIKKGKDHAFKGKNDGHCRSFGRLPGGKGGSARLDRVWLFRRGKYRKDCCHTRTLLNTHRLMHIFLYTYLQYMHINICAYTRVYAHAFMCIDT